MHSVTRNDSSLRYRNEEYKIPTIRTTVWQAVVPILNILRIICISISVVFFIFFFLIRVVNCYGRLMYSILHKKCMYRNLTDYTRVLTYAICSLVLMTASLFSSQTNVTKQLMLRLYRNVFIMFGILCF